MARLFPALLLVLLPTLANAAEDPIAYTLAPVFDGDSLAAVEVSLTFDGDADGETVVLLPGEFAGQAELWRHVSGIAVAGAERLAGPDDRVVLLHAPGAPVTIRYRVASAYAADPGAYAKGGAIVRPGWFVSFGEALFAVPEGRERAAARFAWTGWPAEWTRVSDLDPGFADPSLDANGVVESTLLASPDARRLTRALEGGALQLGVRGTFAFTDAEWADTLARVIGGQRAFWADERARGPYTVTLYELADLTPGSSAGGTGRSDAFAMEATGDMDRAELTRIVAHEHIHSWIPRRIGTLPEHDEALAYWLSEGVTDFYTARTLLRAGVWTAEDFARDLNAALMRQASSPARAAPNAAIADGFWSDDHLQQLSYDRGRLFALLVDYRLRQASDGARGYDDLLRRMRDAWDAAPADAKPDLRGNFEAAASSLDADIAPLIARHIDAGEPIALPADLFAPCGRIETATIARFEPGFDRAASSASGVIAGVVEGGPAWRAGLRDGMERLGWEGSEEGDSRVPMAYRVRDADGERVIAWLPEGQDTVTIQTLVLAPELEPGSDSLRCRAMFAGP